MRLPLVLAASIAIASSPMLPASGADTAGIAAIHQTEAVSAAKRKKQRAAGRQAYGRSQQQIACTQFGCGPIPAGCRIRTGFNPFTWDPSGYDEVVCPYR